MAVVSNPKVPPVALDTGAGAGISIVQKDDIDVVNPATVLNIEGNATVVDDGGGVATVTILTGVNVQDEGGAILTPASTLNFVGAGVTAVDAGSGVATITIPGGVNVQDEGGAILTPAATVNFIGAGVTAVDSGSGVAGVTIPGATKDAWYEAETNGTYSATQFYRVRTVGAIANFSFNFRVPQDFTALTSLVLVFAPNATFGPSGEIDLASDYGAVGEGVENHSESQSLTSVAATLDTWTELDISGVFSVLAAGDFCGVNVDHVVNIGTPLNYLGIRLRYT